METKRPKGTLDIKAYMPYTRDAANSLEFYEKPDGGCPVREYLRANSKAVRSKAGWLLQLLQEKGDQLERPPTDYLEDGIYELRIIIEHTQHRILYFFHKRIIVAAHTFQKKGRRVPKREIDKAKRARGNWRKQEQEKNV